MQRVVATMIDGGANGADAADEQAQRPVVGAVTGGEDARRKWRVGEPAYVGGGSRSVESAAGKVAEVEQQAAEGGDPEAEGVEAREGHVAGANHEGDKVIAEAEENGHADEKHHRGAVHGE